MCRVGWESSHCYYAVSQLFLDPHGNTTVCVSTLSRHKRELVNYFLIDVAQVYRVYMIWELAHNAAMCMTRIIVLLSWLITVDVG